MWHFNSNLIFCFFSKSNEEHQQRASELQGKLQKKVNNLFTCNQ